MKVLCEVVASDLLPTLRSLIVRELIKNYKISQSNISKKLGITESAVSQYKKGARGLKFKEILSNKKVYMKIKKLAREIAEKNYDALTTHVKICKISELIIKEKIQKEKIAIGPCMVR